MLISIFLLLFGGQLILGERILILSDVDQSDVVKDLSKKLKEIPQFEISNILLDWATEETSYNMTCDLFASSGVSGVIDITYGPPWDKLIKEASVSRIPYLKADVTNSKLLLSAMEYITFRKGEDAILLTDESLVLYESLFNILEDSSVRIIIANINETNKLERIKLIRPLPQYFIAYGSAASIVNIYKKVQENQLVKLTERWIFIVSDTKQSHIISQIAPFHGSIAFVIPDLTQFFTYDDKLDFRNILVSSTGEYLRKTIYPNLPTLIKPCTDSNTMMGSKPPELINSSYFPSPSPFTHLNNSLRYSLSTQIILKSMNASTEIGKMNSSSHVNWLKTDNLGPLKRHLKIGVIVSPPWVYYERDDQGNYVKDPLTGEKKLRGYFMEVIEKISEIMNFDYDLIVSPTYGRLNPNDGTWDGIMQNLIVGVIDIAIADLTTTLERDEVIDFVYPYFSQAGFAILFRNPVREKSLFKFTEVLKQEVWLSILGALVLTAFLMWFLEKYSPFSARNNLDKYSEPVRVFDLKESFWFATTSFTPQGGGDSPKSISGRILAAAYWLFVVLILATFSANLAAFLTVERMKSSIQNLDELAQQSKINFSVVRDSYAHDYIRNLAKAENDIYNAWKDISLNDKRNRYNRIWNYPVKEKFQRLLDSIEGEGLVETPEEGFQKVLDNEKGLFAFIHDVTNIKYEYYANCNYSSISETFGEQPLAFAARQGSTLARELGKATLLLQKENFLDSLENKYWNSSLRNVCPPEGDSEGITLQSLGGVFICTIMGIILSIIVLIYEVMERRRKEQNVVQNIPILVKEYQKEKKVTKPLNKPQRSLKF